MVCGTTRTNGDFMGEGDSGGPWWKENTAFGITTGVFQGGDAYPSDECLLFTKAKLFDEGGLGVRVLTISPDDYTVSSCVQANSMFLAVDSHFHQIFSARLAAPKKRRDE